MNTPFSLKDHLFNPPKIKRLAQEIQSVYPQFQTLAFQEAVISRFPDLELKARIIWIAECLHTYLPSDYKKAVAIILKALPEPCDSTLSDDDFGEFIYAAYNEYIARYGCSDAYVDLSLSAIEEVTTRCSAEYAIRSFINAFPEKTLEVFKRWVHHPHYHVRRLVTEGTRPRLPWASNIRYDLALYLPLLDILASDKTRYVTRSIANHLNDVSKINPEAALDRLKAWQTQQKQSPGELSYMIRHSLRTLVKQGHSAALECLGFSSGIKADVTLKLHQTEIRIGETLTFTVTLHVKGAEKVILDFVMTLQGKNGRVSEKVFKLKALNLEPGETVSFEKTYTFKPGMTTRTFYPGEHRLQLQVNGKRLPAEVFVLLPIA